MERTIADAIASSRARGGALDEPPRRRRRVLAIIAFAGTVLIAGIVVGTGPWADTRYAAGYSAEVFDRVAIGDDEQSVRERLGDPIYCAVGADARRYLSYTRSIRSPTHMIRRCIIVDGTTEKVVAIDRKTVWSYGSRLFSQP